MELRYMRGVGVPGYPVTCSMCSACRRDGFPDFRIAVRRHGCAIGRTLPARHWRDGFGAVGMPPGSSAACPWVTSIVSFGSGIWDLVPISGR